MQQNFYETDCMTAASLDHSHIHCQLLTISAYVCHIKILFQWWLLNVPLLVESICGSGPFLKEPNEVPS